MPPLALGGIIRVIQILAKQGRNEPLGRANVQKHPRNPFQRKRLGGLLEFQKVCVTGRHSPRRFCVGGWRISDRGHASKRCGRPLR
jgi:hypothetical protein